ncbi:hypothetical protein [Streptomyces sp. NPDC058751]|uniref:hypothetical protein n=1 Tax=Streptomyces sp. NPDC058751 TaxID=3346623 RepID=UPI0036BD04B5
MRSDEGDHFVEAGQALPDPYGAAMTETPFTSRVQHLFKYITYEQMCDQSGGTRSASWWRHVQLEHTDLYNPPPPKDIPGIARLFGATEEQVAGMIAREFYGVSRYPNLRSERERHFAPYLNALSEEDADLVLDLVKRLNGEADVKQGEQPN